MELNIDTYSYEYILNKLYSLISEKIFRKDFNNTDLFILEKNIKNMTDADKRQPWMELINKTNEYTNTKPNILERAWIYFIYQYKNNEFKKPKLTEIQNIIKDKIQNPEGNDLSLYNGLSGLGLELIRIIESE
jgi:hypothetical protein